MKPVIIDRSLVNMEFNGEVDKKSAFMYVSALAQAGAAYVEVDLSTVVNLPKPSGSENYIYRLGCSEEHVIANALKFAYAVVPLRYSFIISKINVPVILEIEVDGADIFDVLQLISTGVDFARLSMIRLVGDFDPDDVPDIIAKYRRRLVIPIDICPRNDSLNALSSAIAAYRAGADAVTVSFGNNGKFASLEELLIMLSAFYKIIVSPDYLEGICRASIIIALISEERVTNLSIMMRKYMYCPIDIDNIDRLEPKRPNAGRKNYKRSPPAARVLSALGIEKEMSDKIIEVLEDCSIEITGKRMIKDNTELQ